MCGWLRLETARASRSNRWRTSGVSAKPCVRILMATVRSRRVSRARYTSPMPPAPRSDSIWYGPSFVPEVRAICPRKYTPANQFVAAATVADGLSAAQTCELERLTAPDTRRATDRATVGRAEASQRSRAGGMPALQERSLQRRSWDQRQAAGFAVEAAEFDFVEQQRRSDYGAGDAAVGEPKAPSAVPAN